MTDYRVRVNTVPDAGDVRLGGKTAALLNLQDKTRVEVVNMPISSSGKPDIDAEPKGRFTDGYVEPLSFAECLVTFGKYIEWHRRWHYWWLSLYFSGNECL